MWQLQLMLPITACSGWVRTIVAKRTSARLWIWDLFSRCSYVHTYVVVALRNVNQCCRFPTSGFPACRFPIGLFNSSFICHKDSAIFLTWSSVEECAMPSGFAELAGLQSLQQLHVEPNSEQLTFLHHSSWTTHSKKLGRAWKQG